LLENESKTARKRRIELGQHNLLDNRVISKIIQASKIKKEDIVLELGTGDGRITRQLSDYAKRVCSFEIDYRLYKIAKTNCFDRINVKIYNFDLLEFEFQKFDVFISNIPYSRSKEVVKWLCLKKFRIAVIMVQDEFATKLLSRPGEKKFTAISAIAQYCFRLESIMEVPPDAFFPIPRVRSRIIRITPRNKIINAESIAKVEQMFSNNRKKLSDYTSDCGQTVGKRKISQTDLDANVEFMSESVIY
jgi:16S rRNA (adenine1518-N6/adenine1519-N6)-dimethyltransferase